LGEIWKDFGKVWVVSWALLGLIEMFASFWDFLVVWMFFFMFLVNFWLFLLFFGTFPCFGLFLVSFAGMCWNLLGLVRLC